MPIPSPRADAWTAAVLLLVIAACHDAPLTAPPTSNEGPDEVRLSTHAAPGAAEYEVLQLPLPPGYDPADFLAAARALNDAGQVVGIIGGASFGATREPWVWEVGAGLTQLAVPVDPGDGSPARLVTPTGINDAGEIVGYAQFPEDLPVYWAAPGAPAQLLDILPGHGQGQAGGINETGVVAGWSTAGPFETRRVLLWPSGSASPTNPFPNEQGWRAEGINDAGDVAGWRTPFFAPFFSFGQEAFTAVGGTFANLGDLGAFRARAEAINNGGLAVGFTQSPNAAFYWTPDDGVTTVTAAELGGSGAPRFVAVNDAGQIAGRVGLQAIVYTPGEGVVELPPLVPGGSSLIWDINEQGHVAGQSLGADGTFQAVVWVPAGPIAAVIQVTRVINVRGPRGVIPVTVYTTETAAGDAYDFDASVIDPATVSLGPDAASPAHGGHFSDVDGDGDVDAVFHFRVGETGLGCADESATLTGALVDGTAFTGTDEIRVAPACRPR